MEALTKRRQLEQSLHKSALSIKSYSRSKEMRNWRKRPKSQNTFSSLPRERRLRQKYRRHISTHRREGHRTGWLSRLSQSRRTFQKFNAKKVIFAYGASTASTLISNGSAYQEEANRTEFAQIRPLHQILQPVEGNAKLEKKAKITKHIF